MTKAVLIGIVLLIMATAAFFVAFKFMKRSDDRIAVVLMAFFFLTGAFAFIGMVGLPGEMRRKAKACLDDGYTLILDDHEIYSGSIAEELDKYVILEINNEDRWVYIKSTPDSPFSYNQ